MESSESLIIHRNEEQQGVIGNWIQCLTWLHDHTTSRYLIVVEDDVVYCKHARRVLEQGLEAIHDFGYLSAYTPRRDAGLMNGRTGWVEQNRGRDTWGTLCMCFKRESAAQVLSHGDFGSEDRLRGATDYVVADYFLHAGIPCFYHNPSLSDHIGRVSTLGHNWYDDSIGLGFDRDVDLPRPIVHRKEIPDSATTN